MKTSGPCNLPSANSARMGAKKVAEKGRKVSGQERDSTVLGLNRMSTVKGRRATALF